MTLEIQLGKIYKYKQHALNGMEYVIPLNHLQIGKNHYIKFSVIETNKISTLSVGNFAVVYELVENE